MRAAAQQALSSDKLDRRSRQHLQTIVDRIEIELKPVKVASAR